VGEHFPGLHPGLRNVDLRVGKRRELGVDTPGDSCWTGHSFLTGQNSRGFMEDRENRSQLRCGIELQFSTVIFITDASQS
jgi:hypothetical protein